MFKILILLVSSFVLVSSLSGKEFPLDRTLNIKIPNRTTTVIDFPFIIKDKTYESFKQIRKVKKKNSTRVEVPKIKKTVKIIDGKQVIIRKPVSQGNKRKSVNPITITVSKNGNIIELKPNTLGTTKIIVWGYKHYPIMLNIEVSENKDGITDFYKFLDYKEPKKKVVEFESLKHETIIRKLMKHGYLNTVPTGYNKLISNEVEETENYKMSLNTTIVGNKYGLKVYDFLNKSDSPLELKNEMFYKRGFVFSVSIEKLSKKLRPNERTRVFVVFKNKES